MVNFKRISLLSELKYSLSALFLLGFFQLSGQWIEDPCLGSVATGADFESSELVRNTAINHTDIVYYQDNSWGGTDETVTNNLSVAPPVSCDFTKAAFFRVISTDTIGQGIGFKLSSPLEQGNSLNIEFTYISHGFGSAGSFQPKIYTSENGTFQVGGNITAQFIANLPSAEGEWETNTLSYTATQLTAGHQWVFFYAPASSGLLMNMCQIEDGPFEFTATPQIDMCEGESVWIGEEFSEDLDIDYSWSNGSTDAMIEVSAGGLYVVQASNQCNQQSGNFFVVEHGDPRLNIEADTLFLCEGETEQLWAIGYNPVATWPDGSTDSIFVVTEEGPMLIEVSDECFDISIDIYVDFDSVPFIDLGPDFTLCSGETAFLDATVPEDVDYLWDNGSIEPIRFVTFQNVYEVTLTNDCGSFTESVFVEYSPEPEGPLRDTTYVCYGRRIILDASHIEGEYLWQDGTTASEIWTDYTGIYWVQIIDDDDCFVLTDSTYVVENLCGCPVYIPNAFTPDGDGINDHFGCVFDCAPYDYHMVIFNRWGSVVSKLDYATQTWDGRYSHQPVQNDVYGYQVTYRETYDGIPIKVSGSVVVIGAKR